MGIAGNEMHHATGEPSPRVLLRARTKHTSEGTGGNLHITALGDPFSKTFRMSTENAVSFGMRDDGADLGEPKFMQGMVQRGRDRKLVEFHQQIIFLIDAVRARIAAQ